MGVLTELSLFTGYGGFKLGLRAAGIPTKTVCYVENDPYCQKVIKARIEDGYLDDAPIWDDATTFDGRPWCGLIDLITAGFPCQPHSTAGKRAGPKDSRDLWPTTLRIIREVRPSSVLLENVPGLAYATDGRPPYAGRVVGELAEAGYDAEWRCVSAADVGAPHRRERWWCLAYPRSSGHGRTTTSTRGAPRRQPASPGSPLADPGLEYQQLRRGQSRAEPSGEGSELADPSSRRLGEGERNLYEGEPDALGGGNVAITGRDGRGQDDEGSGASIGRWPPAPGEHDTWAEVLRHDPSLEPALRRVADGLARGVDGPQANRVQRLRALGNGVVPQALARFLKEVIGGL